jgi:hypothetical protein
VILKFRYVGRIGISGDDAAGVDQRNAEIGTARRYALNKRIYIVCVLHDKRRQRFGERTEIFFRLILGGIPQCVQILPQKDKESAAEHQTVYEKKEYPCR